MLIDECKALGVAIIDLLTSVHRLFSRPVGYEMTPLLLDIGFGEKKKRTCISPVSLYLVGSLCGRNMPKHLEAGQSRKRSGEA